MNNAVKLQQIGDLLDKMVKVGSHFDDIYDAFLIYDQYKGNLDIDIYERSLEMYKTGLRAMNEQIENFYDIMNAIKDVLE
jgi:hypothetical protein